MSNRINHINSEHLPKAGAMFFEKPIAKAGHKNTLVDYMDAPKIGDIKRSETRDLIYKGRRVKGLFADIENMPVGAHKIYKGGGFPSVSAEIAPNYLGQGPMIRAAALQGMVPPSLKGQPKLDIFSQLFSEGEALEKIASVDGKENIDLFTLNFSEFSEIQEEDSMTQEEIKKLVADTTKATMDEFGKEIKKGLTEQFAEFTKKDQAPEISKEAQAQIDGLQADIKKRDTDDRNNRVVQFGEFVNTLKEREKDGVKIGLPPAVLEDVKAFGTTLADPEAETCRFAEGEPMRLLDAFIEVVKKVAESKPLRFSEINVPNEDQTQAEADIAAGKNIHK